MATFPSYVKLGWRDTAEKPTPVVLRSEMEKGLARQRRVAADSVVTVPVTAYFDTAADSLAFETWFFGDVGAGAAWFDFTLPRSGAVTQARVVGGDIGQLKPATKNWAFSERTFQLEYVRPGFVTLAPGLHTVSADRILGVQRNSTATYIDDAGLLPTAPANTARWQDGKLLVEAEATNIALRSAEFDNAIWVKSLATVVPNAATAPSGALAMDKVVASVVNDRHELRSNGGAIAATLPADVHTFSVFGLAAELRYLSLIYTTGGGVGFDLLTGTVVGTPTGGATAAIRALAGGVCRCSMRFTPTGASGAVYICLRNTAGVGVEFFLGDGSSGLYLWGAQMEAGELSSYIPTTSAAATRAADLITVAA